MSDSRMEVTAEFLVVTCPTTKNRVFLASDGSFVTAHPLPKPFCCAVMGFFRFVLHKIAPAGYIKLNG